MKIEVMDGAMAQVLRHKTGEERLQIAFGMWRFARQVIMARVRQQHPDWSKSQVQGEVSRRLLHGAI